MRQGVMRSKKCEESEARLKAALEGGVVDRGLPFHVARVIFRDDGTAWARLEVDLEYTGVPMAPARMAAGMLARLVEASQGVDRGVRAQLDAIAGPEGGEDVARDIARQRRAR